MMVMPANHSSARFHYWAGRYPGKLGWLVGPSAIAKTTLRPWVPFALDNDAFSAWAKKRPWDEDAWLALLWWVAARATPMWALVPDVVADRGATLAAWSRYAPMLPAGWPKAFAVQDGMGVADVPGDADVVFVGGTSDWKWATVAMWAAAFPRVHVGRVNTLDRLRRCERLGVESVDGTGWFRRCGRSVHPTQDLSKWIEAGDAAIVVDTPDMCDLTL